MPGQNPMVSPNAQQLNSQGNAGQQSNSTQQGPGNQQAQHNAAGNSRASPGPSDENMKKALAALGLPAQQTPGWLEYYTVNDPSLKHRLYQLSLAFVTFCN